MCPLRKSRPELGDADARATGEHSDAEFIRRLLGRYFLRS